MPKVLLAWLGRTDINCSLANDPQNPGPTARVLEERKFKAVVFQEKFKTTIETRIWGR